MAVLSVAQAKEIASCKQHPGHCLLAETLGLGSYEEERNLQNAIKVDFLYDHLMFAVNKGFTWEQVCFVVDFAYDFLADAVEKSLTQMVKTYQAQSADLFGNLGERNYKIFTDFLFTTFFTHFQLFKHVLTNPRAEKIPQVHVHVHPPIPPMPLSSAKALSVWNYEHAFEKLEQRDAELEKQREQRKQQLEAEVNVKRAACQSHVTSAPTPFTKETLSEMIRSVMEDYASATSKAIATEIQGVREDLESKLDMTALPRPAALGQPPRYQPKPAIQPLPKPGAAKAAKVNSKDKSKSPKSPKSPNKLSPQRSPQRSRASSSRASRKH